MKDVEIIIAKYKEDTSWALKLTQPYTIYDKSNDPVLYSVRLPNVGRETHTYLYHIIKNYDNLAEVTVFLQGNPVDHSELLGYSIDNCIIALNALDKNISFNSFFKNTQIDLNFEHYRFIMSSKIFKEGVSYFPHDRSINVLDLMNQNISYFVDGMNMGEYIASNLLIVPPFSAGAQYIVPKKNILARPLDFWKKLFRMCQSHVLYLENNYRFLDGYCFERMWPLLFNPAIQIHPDFLTSPVPTGDGKVEVVIVSDKEEKMPYRKYLIHSCREYKGKNKAYHYINHIIINYDNLAELTVFTNDPDTTSFINDMNQVKITQGLAPYRCTLSKDTDPRYYILIERLQLFSIQVHPDLHYFSGGQYCVPKVNITSKPLIFWKKLLELSETSPPELFERMWILLFSPDVPIHPDFTKN